MRAYNNLLRPKKELYATTINSALCVTSLTFRELLVFTPALGFGCALFFFVNASVRGRQAWVLFQYHRNLVSSKPFTLTSRELPKTAHAYYLGRGFEWTPEHTKRLKDLYKRKNMDFMYETAIEKRIKQWALLRRDKGLGKLVYPFINSHHALNPYPPRNPTGNSAIHGVGMWEKEEKILIDLNHARHILCAGGTGTGKSTTMMELIQQDINAGRTTLVFDPKGGYKVFSAMYDAIKRNDLTDTFIIIILSSPEYSAQYNAFSSYHRITEIATRLSQGIESEENFKQFAWLKINYIAVGLHYIGQQPTFENIKYYVHRCDELLVKYCQAYIENQHYPQDKFDELLAVNIKKLSRQG